MLSISKLEVIDVDGLVACVCEQLSPSGGALAPDMLGHLEAVEKQKLYLEGKKSQTQLCSTEMCVPISHPHSSNPGACQRVLVQYSTRPGFFMAESGHPG